MGWGVGIVGPLIRALRIVTKFCNHTYCDQEPHIFIPDWYKRRNNWKKHLYKNSQTVTG